MYAKDFPVYNIQQFNYPRRESDFYVRESGEHIRKFSHVLGNLHKHDHYLTLLFTHGSGTHEIDFISYPFSSGYLFLLSPGQVHNLTVSPDAEGYVLLHTKDFYDVNYSNKRVRNYPFFCSNRNSPEIILQNEDLLKIIGIFNELIKENMTENLMKDQILCSLVDILYINLTRLYLPKKSISNQRQNYLLLFLKLEDFIDLHFKKEKSPAAYASMMAMTIKHLNRICHSCLGKTTTEIILARVMLEAKRMLARGIFSVEEVAIELGYFDTSYFIRLFKKSIGLTPMSFMKRYQKNNK